MRLCGCVLRAEVAAVEAAVRAVAEDVLPGVVCMAAGSYRRGKESCGDIDILITHPSGTCTILSEVVSRLSRMGVLTDHLMLPVPQHLAQSETYFGVCIPPLLVTSHGMPPSAGTDTRHTGSTALISGTEVCPAGPSDSLSQSQSQRFDDAVASLRTDGGVSSRDDDVDTVPDDDADTIPDDEGGSSGACDVVDGGGGVVVEATSLATAKHRRVDIKTYPYSQFPYALLHFTGPDHFNRTMRFRAKQMCVSRSTDVCRVRGC